ncbi:formylglycine-generating enzyme family protein [Singulisphaera sp. PoT]|uniref:formylglycine-generating enzyme family protein n=1 Tax=Singulisphaera sp. PoT TaxID=3411797 RepID=UPI003BF5C3EC
MANDTTNQGQNIDASLSSARDESGTFALLKRLWRYQPRADWPPWSKIDQIGLARYVTIEAKSWVAIIDPNVPPVPATNPADRKKLAEAIYQALRSRDFPTRYAIEKLNWAESTQRIREPGEILEAPREGTCLDLAVLFAGLCLGYRLLPIVVVLKGHAFALVSLGFSVDEYWKFRAYQGVGEEGESNPLLMGILRGDPSHMIDWVDSGDMIAVECTGFTRMNAATPEDAARYPECAGRDANGFLTFEMALTAGRRQLETATRPLQFGLNVEAAHRLGVDPYQIRGPGDYSQAWRRRVVRWAAAAAMLAAAIGIWAASSYLAIEQSAAQLADQLRSSVGISQVHAIASEAGWRVQSSCRGRLKSFLHSYVPRADDDDEAVRLAREHARAAVGLYHLGDQGAALRRVLDLGEGPCEPQARSFAIRDTAASGVLASVTLSWLPAANTGSDSLRRALILCLGDYGAADFSDPVKLRERLKPYYMEDDDPGVHAAAYWILKRIARAGDTTLTEWSNALRETGASRLQGKDKTKHHWYVDKPTGITFIYLPEGQRVIMGNRGIRLEDRGGSPYVPRCVRLPRAFVIAMTEITREQFAAVMPDTALGSPRDAAKTSVTWDQVAEFCNRMIVGTEDDCYRIEAPNAERRMIFPVVPGGGHLKKTGFRHPTEAEWEYACRANSLARFAFGSDEELIDRYASRETSAIPVATRRPNDFGFFDMHGGAAEWCDDNWIDFPNLAEGECPEDASRVDYPTASVNVESLNAIRTVAPSSSYERTIRSRPSDVNNSIAWSAFRREHRPQYKPFDSPRLGFRLARTVDQFPPGNSTPQVEP